MHTSETPHVVVVEGARPKVAKTAQKSPHVNDDALINLTWLLAAFESQEA